MPGKNRMMVKALRRVRTRRARLDGRYIEPAFINPGTRKHIFVSIPRNASRGVHSMLGLRHRKDHSRPDDRGILDNHATCLVLRDRYGEVEFAERFKFCLVRNPWERCVSWYEHHRTLEPYSRLSFRDWVLAGLPHHWTVQNGTDYHRSSPLWQHSFITDTNGDLMVDSIGRVERFLDDMIQICETIGISTDLAAKSHTRPSRTQLHYREYYDDQTRGAVRTLLQRDILLFGYEF
jgi:hypothetical protein